MVVICFLARKLRQKGRGACVDTQKWQEGARSSRFQTIWENRNFWFPKSELPICKSSQMANWRSPWRSPRRDGQNAYMERPIRSSDEGFMALWRSQGCQNRNFRFRNSELPIFTGKTDLSPFWVGFDSNIRVFGWIDLQPYKYKGSRPIETHPIEQINLFYFFTMFLPLKP